MSFFRDPAFPGTRTVKCDVMFCQYEFGTGDDELLEDSDAQVLVIPLKSPAPPAQWFYQGIPFSDLAMHICYDCVRAYHHEAVTGSKVVTHPSL